jgi:hypothetical protein
MLPLRRALVAIAIAAPFFACSSKDSRPPISTQGPSSSGGLGGGGGGTASDGGGAQDSGAGDDSGVFDASDAFAPCSQGTCPGCCDSANVCQPGNTAASCGVNGQLCLSCTQAGLTCGAAGNCQ